MDDLALLTVYGRKLPQEKRKTMLLHRAERGFVMEGVYRLFQETPQLLVLRIAGKLSSETTLALVEEVERKVDHADGFLFMLIDLSQAGVPSTQGQLHLVRMLRNANLSGAIFSRIVTEQAISKAMIRAVGVGRRWRWFLTEEQARAWAKEYMDYSI